MTKTEFKLMDKVVLVTTRRITYLSGPPDASITPHGCWQVAGGVNGLLLLTKDSTVIRIPPQDVRLVKQHDISLLDKQLRSILDGLPIARTDTGAEES